MKYKEKANKINYFVSTFTLNNISKFLLLVILSSFSFSKDIYLALGIDDSELKSSTTHYMYKKLYASIETRLSNFNHSSSIGVGVELGKFDISRYYTYGKGTFPVDGISYTEHDTRVKLNLFKLIGLNFYIALEGKDRFYNKKLYAYNYINVGVYRKINNNFYINVLSQANYSRAPRSEGSNISSSLMLGYVYKY